MSGAPTTPAPGAPAGAPPGAGGPPPFGLRLALGLLGVLMAAITSGLNNRVGGLGLPDIRGNLGWGLDESAWLSTVYTAGELVAMPFATWFAITFSMRRFQFATLGGLMLIALVMPFVHSLPLALALRGLQGVLGGCQIPVLMMAALRFLPLSIRLHGLALYAMTATFAPNIAIWVSAVFLDRLEDWRWIYWHVIPLGALAIALIAYGVPVMPMALPRLKGANWWGMLFGITGLAALAVALDQGAHWDWFNSPWFSVCLIAGGTLTMLFLLAEWFHPAPFIRLQLLERRNLGLGFTVFFILVVVLLSGASLPALNLGHVQGFRAEQIAPIGLMIALPQLVLGSVVALLLYQKWVDARYVFVLGLIMLASACYLASTLTDEWMVAEFAAAEILQALGQPMAVVSLLFLATSVVQPMEGPYVSGIVNTLRAFGTLFGSAVINRLVTVRSDFHQEMLLDGVAHFSRQFSLQPFTGRLGSVIGEQAGILATADAYRILGILALILIPLVLMLQYIAAPSVPNTTSSRG